jgi:hypothetical protein
MSLAGPDLVDRYAELLDAWRGASADDRRRLLIVAKELLNEPLWLPDDTAATVAMRIMAQLSGKRSWFTSSSAS